MVQGVGFKTLGFGVDVQGLRFRVSNLGFRHWDDPLNPKP